MGSGFKRLLSDNPVNYAQMPPNPHSRDEDFRRERTRRKQVPRNCQRLVAPAVLFGSGLPLSARLRCLPLGYRGGMAFGSCARACLARSPDPASSDAFLRSARVIAYPWTCAGPQVLFAAKWSNQAVSDLTEALGHQNLSVLHDHTNRRGSRMRLLGFQTTGSFG